MTPAGAPRGLAAGGAPNANSQPIYSIATTLLVEGARLGSPRFPPCPASRPALPGLRRSGPLVGTGLQAIGSIPGSGRVCVGLFVFSSVLLGLLAVVLRL